MQVTITIAIHPRRKDRQIALVETESGTKYVLFGKGKLNYAKVLVQWRRNPEKFRHLNSNSAATKLKKQFRGERAITRKVG